MATTTSIASIYAPPRAGKVQKIHLCDLEGRQLSWTRVGTYYPPIYAQKVKNGPGAILEFANDPEFYDHIIDHLMSNYRRVGFTADVGVDVCVEALQRRLLDRDDETFRVQLIPVSPAECVGCALRERIRSCVPASTLEAQLMKMAKLYEINVDWYSCAICGKGTLRFGDAAGNIATYEEWAKLNPDSV